jgi:hypothetical protein
VVKHEDALVLARVPETLQAIASALDPPLDIAIAQLLVSDMPAEEIARTILINAPRDLT